MTAVPPPTAYDAWDNARPVAVDVDKLAPLGMDALAVYAAVMRLDQEPRPATIDSISVLYATSRDRISAAVDVLRVAGVVSSRTPPELDGSPCLGRADLGGTWPSADPLPRGRKAAVYHLFLEDELRYVGMTEALARRLRQHATAGRRFDRWTAYLCVDRAAASAREIEHIKRLNPVENVEPGGPLGGLLSRDDMS